MVSHGAVSPRHLGRHAEPQAAVTLPAGNRLRCSPAWGKVERLLGAAVGTGAPRVGREFRRAEALEKLPQAVGEERRHQDEVRDRDEYAQQRDAPPLAEPREGAPYALLVVEVMNRHAAAGRLPVIAAEDEGLNARAGR